MSSVTTLDKAKVWRSASIFGYINCGRRYRIRVLPHFLRLTVCCNHHPHANAHEISRPRILTISTAPHIMGSDIDLETGQVAQVTPRAGEFFHALITLHPLEVLAVREEEVGRVETHEMDILGPHTSREASSLRSVPTGQNINEAQLVVSQAEGATSFFTCCLIYRQLFCSVTLFNRLREERYL